MCVLLRDLNSNHISSFELIEFCLRFRNLDEKLPKGKEKGLELVYFIPIVMMGVVEKRCCGQQSEVS